jgi:hypothetical protein
VRGQRVVVRGEIVRSKPGPAKARRVTGKSVRRESMSAKRVTGKGMAAESVAGEGVTAEGVAAKMGATKMGPAEVRTAAVPAAAVSTATAAAPSRRRWYIGRDQERAQGSAGRKNSNRSFGHGLPPSSVALTLPRGYPGGRRNRWTTSELQTFSIAEGLPAPAVKFAQGCGATSVQGARPRCGNNW